MAHILGVGGIFLTSPDPDALRAWYKTHLGLELDPQYGMIFPYKTAQDAHGPGAMTVFSIWKEGADYIKPATRDAIINFIVDELDPLLEALKSQGVALVGEPVTEDYGKFAWIMDPDGRKIELWQPTPPPGMMGEQAPPA